ncbi:hypothetical protein SpAn4DRAFT_3588 [Sporomusa ovata]|uniref:Uncharacterized protein n=1 Tax=Sporomusa ovata TaxID=2378 RepID=A0A0U1KWB1_9FIRM|nr:hypothetical protein SpAn4DRAFT_3588 [Sporomusa ovata]
MFTDASPDKFLTPILSVIPLLCQGTVVSGDGVIDIWHFIDCH